MTRYRLITLFVATAIVSLFAASLTSHRNARTEVKSLDSHVDAALRQLSPQVSARLEINAGREDFPPLDPYSFVGNGVGTALGGLFDGPSSIERDVVVADGVNLTIESRSDWAIFPSGGYVLIHPHEGDENDWFIDNLKQILMEQGISIAAGG